MAAYSGFAEGDFDSVCIILDKMDKIGLDGVENELAEAGFAKESIDKYLDLFKGMEGTDNGLAYLAGKLEGFLDEEIKENLSQIIESVDATKTADFKMVFDPTLVRGMGYYTGTIFEIAIPEFGGSCGGGGRYDKMIGNFTGQDTPACGFSIGFERIVLLLLESGFKVPNTGSKKAFLVEKGLDTETLCKVIEEAKAERAEGKTVQIVRMNKNKKFQKEQLISQGYDEFKEFYKK